MTPKERAIELRFKYWKDADLTLEQAQRCAIMAVDEMLVQINELVLVYGELNGTELGIGIDAIPYWQEVKQEIENLND